MRWFLSILLSGIASAQNPLAEAVAQANEALGLVDRGRYTEAEQLYQTALRGRYDDDLVRAKIAHNLALLYRDEDRYSDSEQMFRSALQWRQKNLPAGSIEVAYSLNNLAEIYRIEGRDWEARNLMETAARSLQEFHPDAPGVPLVLSNLAAMLCKFQVFDEAEGLLRVAMISYQKQQRVASREYALALSNLGQVLESEKHLEAAAPLYEQAIGILENLGAQGRPYLASVLANSGTLYQRVGRIEDARQAEERALGLLRPMGDEAMRATILRNLAIILAGTAKPADSLPYFEESLTIQERTLVPESLPMVDLLRDYASAAMRAGNKPLSRKLHKRADELLSRLTRQSPEKLTVSVDALR
jgi:tetratricopeptide (TPR) repeat protein